ncbi:MAG: M28 family peptidase [Flavobacteriaceae bacterium]
MIKKLQFFFLILIFFSNYNIAQTYSSFYNGIVNNISSTNILADLTTFESLGVKQIGTVALDNTQAWIKSRYETLGYTDIVEQPFSYSSGTTNNIIITKVGNTYPNRYVIIDGHYDTINGTGTNDNGSGTVLLLELARLFKDIETEYSIKFIHFSGEEDGLIGSNYYVNNTVIPQSLDIELVFNIDEVGGVNGMINDTIVCEQDTSTPTANNAASATMTQILANCIELYSTLHTEISYAYASDYIPFENNGEIITGLYEKNESPYAHTSNDVLTNMDVDYLVQVTKGALGAALHFAVGVQTLSNNDQDELEKSIIVYPNPSSGFINLKNTSSKEFKLTIVNVLGKEVYKTIVNTNTESLDLTSLSKGVYMAVFKNGTTSFSKKIILN